MVDMEKKNVDRGLSVPSNNLLWQKSLQWNELVDYVVKGMKNNTLYVIKGEYYQHRITSVRVVPNLCREEIEFYIEDRVVVSVSIDDIILKRFIGEDAFTRYLIKTNDERGTFVIARCEADYYREGILSYYWCDNQNGDITAELPKELQNIRTTVNGVVLEKNTDKDIVGVDADV